MTSHSSIILAVTGGIACGKSEVGRILAQQGFAVLDTDWLAHQLMKTGTPVFQKTVERFGSTVIGSDGEIDRAVLGRIVFDDPDALKALNRIVHPTVMKAVEQWKVEQAGDAAVLVPLLFEVGWCDGWGAIICVSADEEQVFQRLETRGMKRGEATRRVAAQMPLKEKEERADFIIENNGSLDALHSKVDRVIKFVRR